jgi:glycosyltransferase involved in cell wall biosynthesis
MAAERQESMPAPAKPFFSIVVPTWNRGRLIGETIDSLLNQDFPRSQYEVIVVDDGSTDDTAERLEPFLGRIQVIRQPKSGIAAARNLGARHAAGDYMVPFDSDDIMLPHALNVYKMVIETFQRPPVVLSSNGWFCAEQRPDFFANEPDRIECIRCNDYFGKAVQTGTFSVISVLRLDSVLRTGGYSQDCFEDSDLIFRLGTIGPMIKILKPITAAVRLHDSNSTRSLCFLTEGLITRIRNERHGVYPGGWRRMLDRRGLIGSDALSCLKHYYIGARHAPVGQRLWHTVRVLAHLRGMVPAALLRKCLSWFYFREARTIEYPRCRCNATSSHRS